MRTFSLVLTTSKVSGGGGSHMVLRVASELGLGQGSEVRGQWLGWDGWDLV